MALPAKSEASLEEEIPSHDPVLQRLAKSDTFDSDWATLRHHLHLALLSCPPLFNSLPQPQRYSFPPNTPLKPVRSSPTTSPLTPKAPSPSGSAPPSSSLRLSTTASASPSSSPLSASDEPSTLGGLVIPPFPPLDPERRNQRKLSAGIIGPVPPAVAARVNGSASGPGGLSARGNVFEDEWDEAVVIGGKKLPGWLGEEEGKKEVDRVGKMIDDLAEPPFTIQRLAELLLNPTKQHSTLGKFLRALEKNLLVTTPWSAPSYIPVPPSTFSGSRGLFGPTSSPSSTSSSSASPSDTSSTMPVGSTTPMFSPIPFLVRPPIDGGDSMDIDMDGAGDEGKGAAQKGLLKADEIVSPLVLDRKELEETREEEKDVQASLLEVPTESSSSANNAGSGGRSPTPEPEDHNTRSEAPSVSSTTSASVSSDPTPAAIPVLTGNESSDPAHQPYLGRVDELDTGPITSLPSHSSASASSSSASKSRSEGDSDSGNGGGSGGGREQDDSMGSGSGTGEGGNMTPHGMSERPVPISATTTVQSKEEEGAGRKVAGLPRTKSVLSLSERFAAAEATGEGEREEAGAEDVDMGEEGSAANTDGEVVKPAGQEAEGQTTEENGEEMGTKPEGS
ncbi:putative methionine aminopeptidase 1 [Dioszegia hungarica]|uniref:Methionine aminopeptidase 1 n=1 Tax=Dioszegia hungarica TaxID=4972 RepID=A0AA38HCJ1_9TREE|nr:putative methionine aminopeptidase 1 [Dioszegia hungarica]KAI9637940.1 putative methionine aminopeptidase 1 [Dioszegia hungarica]